MTSTEAYNGIYDAHPDSSAHRVFFAFSNEQIEEGMKKCGYKDTSEIVHAGQGMYGSRENLRAFLAEYDNRAERVKNECDPQKVYEYEFGNHECGYTGTDEEAIKLVVDIFGKDRAKQVVRQHAVISIDGIEEDI